MRPTIFSILLPTATCFVTLPLQYAVREQNTTVFDPSTSMYFESVRSVKQLVVEAEVEANGKSEFVVNFGGHHNTCISSTNDRCGNYYDVPPSPQNIIVGDSEVLQVSFSIDNCVGNHLKLGVCQLMDNEVLTVDKMNFVQLMKYQKKIKSASVSFHFPDKEDSQGSLVVGGIDHSKYEGALQKVPFVNSRKFLGVRQSDSIEIVLNEILNNGQALATGYYAMELSGSFGTYLPDKFVDAIASRFGGIYDELANIYLYGPNVTTTNETISFSFSGASIIVPVRKLVTECGPEAYCLSLSLNFNENVGIVGMDVLKNAYLVIDYDNQEVGLAQAYLANSEGTLLIEEMMSSIPSATEAAQYSSTFLDGYYHVTKDPEENEVVTVFRAIGSESAEKRDLKSKRRYKNKKYKKKKYKTKGYKTKYGTETTSATPFLKGNSTSHSDSSLAKSSALLLSFYIGIASLAFIMISI